MVSKPTSIEADLWAIAVDASKFALLDGTGLEYAPIGDSDDYAVRDKERPADEIRRAGDDFRKLGAVLSFQRTEGEQSSADGLHEIDVDEDRYQVVKGTGLEYAKVNDHDAFSVRDPEHPGDIRRPGDDWRKLGTIL
ncbi:Fe-S cluster assembly iron-binding protein IscA [Nonomuraea thailandensis]|uniref:Fe-S cluster assembly iron-binding protein IscA n=1 Tax=Nonomuraea thailandensis TaxID=1188745 RepID=A0A9X2GYW2_9ACTN|nr:hypothetical protein [Nonomuraea thailandensis]MCP2364306.1 Fe-S cluster assembly iron-binding protein IscA [Nonomuraea thailandensis]